MTARALITGGAGFIGSHLADELLAHGYTVRALDLLDPHIHGSPRKRPAYLARDVELIVGDVRDPAAVRSALAGVDLVFHLAARVGGAPSMYQISDYTSVNNLGTAILLEALIDTPVKRLVVTSSMSVYGEGLYRSGHEQIHDDVVRTPEQLVLSEWEPTLVGQPLVPVPTPESKPSALGSVYAMSKHDQERMCLITGAAYKIPTVALRLFNVYGPRQSLTNPYTGVVTTFAAHFLNGKPPLVFEDGRQQRDFVHVRDVAIACRLAAESSKGVGEVFNVGSGHALTILEVAEHMRRVLGVGIDPEITGKHRVGDIRHCTADIGRARRVLGYRPTMELVPGLEDLAAWLATQQYPDHVHTMRAALARRGLAV